MALKRRRNGNSGSIDSARTASYGAMRGIRRNEGPTDTSGVFTIKNFNIDDDNALVLRDPILLNRTLPAGITGTYYKTVYSFDGNRENDLFITSNGIYDSLGNILPITIKDKYGDEKSLTFNNNIEVDFTYTPIYVNNYKIKENITYSNFSTSTIINNILMVTEVKTLTVSGFGLRYIPRNSYRYIRYSIIGAVKKLEVLTPTEVNLLKTFEGEGIIFNPNFYNDVLQDVTDNYEGQTFDVLGILQYVKYDYVNKSISDAQLNNLTINTLLRSRENIRYAVATGIPEGTPSYLKAFLNIKKYPRSRVFCAWEESVDGVYYTTSKEFELKFQNKLIELKIKKDSVDPNEEPKTIKVVELSSFSDDDYVDERPDVLAIKADTKLRKFVLYTLPGYERVVGKKNSDVGNVLNLNELVVPSDLASRHHIGNYNTNDFRHPSAKRARSSNTILIGSLEEKGVGTADTTHRNIVDLKEKLQQISVLQNNKTTEYDVTSDYWFVRAFVEYNDGISRYEVLKRKNTTTKYLNLEIEQLEVERPTIPHKVKIVSVVNLAVLPDAIYPWRIKYRNGGGWTGTVPEYLPLHRTNANLPYNQTVGAQAAAGDFVTLNATKPYIKNNIYQVMEESISVTYTPQDYLEFSLASFGLTNMNEINHNAISCSLEVDGFSITDDKSIKTYELKTSPVIGKHNPFGAQLFAPSEYLKTSNNNMYSFPIYAKPFYGIVNKSKLSTVTVPKQELKISENLKTNVFYDIANIAGVTDIKPLSIITSQDFYENWLNMFSKENISLTNPYWSGISESGLASTYINRYSVLTNTGQLDYGLYVETLLSSVTEESSFSNSRTITIERPKVKVFYDCTYPIVNKTEVIVDAIPVFGESNLPTTTKTYYKAGNTYEVVIATTSKSLKFNGTHIAYIDKYKINLISETTALEYVSLLSDELVVDTTDLGSPAQSSGMLNYKKSLYAYDSDKLKNNILVSKTGTFEFPLTNLLDLDASEDASVTALIPWRDYLIAATNFAIYLVNKTEGGFTSKIINTFTGIPEKDKLTLISILNGLIFKSSEKLFVLSPNSNSSVDSILNLSEISKPIANLLNIDYGNSIAIGTDSYYGVFLTDSVENKTYFLRYDYGTRIFTFMEYPIRVKQAYINSVQEIYITDYAGKEYYFNKNIPENLVDIIGYGDVLNTKFNELSETTVVTPISFEIDSGEKTQSVGYEKNFVETRVTFGLKSAKEVIPVTLEVYADGHKQIAHKAVETDSPFWNDSLDDLAALNTGFDTNSSQIVNTLKELRIRHHGFGKTIRHVLKGNSVTKFKIYVVYYKYRNLPGEE
jgi:hypothetical protein